MKSLLKGRHFYLLSILPALGPFGSKPPLGKQRLWTLITESEGPSEIVYVLLLCDDLIQREAVLAGELDPDQAETAVLPTPGAEEQTLPDFISSGDEDQGDEGRYRAPADLLWEQYFRHVLKTAKKFHSAFLEAWAQYEVGLRNAIALRRAEILEFDAEPYLVAKELTDPSVDFSAPLAEWSGASNSYAAFEVLERFRWDRLTETEPWYLFNDDEVAAYTAKLMLLHRWHRLSAVSKA